MPTYTPAVPSESSLPMTGSSTSSAPQPSTQELVVGCRNGDKASWAKLVARYETLVYTVARRNGLGPDDAADVTQTTFATLLEELDVLREAERLPYWLATVARRQSWRLKRRAEREPLIAVEEGFGVDPFIDWERFEVINEAMGRLGDPCRTLLMLLFFDPAQPSHAEVADRLGRALGGIGPLRGRCLAKLRSLLGEDSPW
jgi:RNA polymerase sigma factor (sigma-70 family)